MYCVGVLPLDKMSIHPNLHIVNISLHKNTENLQKSFDIFILKDEAVLF